MFRGPTGQAEVRVTLPHGQVARALLGVALGLAAAAGETVLAWQEKQAALKRLQETGEEPPRRGRPTHGREPAPCWANLPHASVLTVRITLAELLAEILGHDARAGAVARVLGMVTGLVVVHLSG